MLVGRVLPRRIVARPPGHFDPQSTSLESCIVIGVGVLKGTRAGNRHRKTRTMQIEDKTPQVDLASCREA